MKKEYNFQAFIISRFLVILILVIAVEWIVKMVADWILIQLIQKDIMDLSASIWENSEELIPLLITVSFFIIPILVAAVWFSRIVMDEADRMEEHKKEMRLLYEKKRNLMLSDIAHDLKTPITTIAGYAKALNDGMIKDEEKEKEYLTTIESKAERMNELITLLFEYVKLDSAYFTLNIQNENIAELLRKNAAFLYSDMEEKGMFLEMNVPEEPCIVAIDTLQFSRAITNLITNAIKHNPSGTRIGLELIQEKHYMEIRISDNGELIPKFLAEHIFEPFAIGDSSRKAQTGSGLGLSIAEKIIQMHGWELRLEQDEEKKEKAFVIKIEFAST